MSENSPSNESLKQKKAVLIAAYKTVFRGPEGKVVLEDLITRFNILATTFDPDPTTHAHNEGARYAALYILGKLNTTPEEIDRAYGEIKSSLEWGEE